MVLGYVAVDPLRSSGWNVEGFKLGAEAAKFSAWDVFLFFWYSPP